ncbi:YdcF family protein [Candidatus Uhrbacteria bacterium]|nr:YdcF family protein [Candidatus Uhrbacteria bacterium]
MNVYLKRALKALIGTAAAAVVFVTGVISYVQLAYVRDIVTAGTDLRPVEYAIVLGASVKQDGTPSDALYDRVMEAVDAYKAGKVKKLIMTGDDGGFHVDEVETMADLAIKSGVTSTDVIVDGQGYRTYESCKRAATVYGVKEAVVVTQRFHLGRALFLCHSFGIDTQGLPADRRPYQRILFFIMRDLTSSFKAWMDVYLWPPKSPVEQD